MNDDEIDAYVKSRFAQLDSVLRPPTSMADSSAWDTYSQNQVAHADEFLAGLLGGRPFAGGRTARFVAGDLLDPTICPAPYDVIIERKTLQLYPPEVQSLAISAVAARLGRRGIFFSHSHRNGPPDRWRYPVSDWVQEQGGPYTDAARRSRDVPLGSIAPPVDSAPA